MDFLFVIIIIIVSFIRRVGHFQEGGSEEEQADRDTCPEASGVGRRRSYRRLRAACVDKHYRGRDYERERKHRGKQLLKCS